MLASVVLAAGLLGIGAWAYRRYHGSLPAAPAGRGMGRPSVRAVPAAAGAPAPPPDLARLEAANVKTTGQLWKLAFAAPSESRSSLGLQRRVRGNIVAMLEVDSLDADFFPRRPALMPQLLEAVNDPHAAAGRISRIIAHDPVLTADVLRLANSSLYRRTVTPLETIPRAIVACGVESLRGMLATAMLRPVFKATRKNFPRLPRMLWERTELAVRAAELHALETSPENRFEAQLAVLHGALGPLVVYSAALDVYARNPHFAPSAALCVELIGEWAPRMSVRIACDWESSPRLRAALEGSPAEPLSIALRMGEFLGTLALLETHAVISAETRRDLLLESGAGGAAVERIWTALAARA